MMMKKDMEQLLAWVRQAQEVFALAGETDFGELRRKEKQAIFDALTSTDLDYDTDGDSDGVYLLYNIDNVAIHFGGHSESSCPEDIREALDYMDVIIDNYDVNIDRLADYLEQLMSNGVNMVNLTPHVVTFYGPDGTTILRTVPSSGVARAAQERETIGDINGIPVSRTSYGTVEGLPDPVPNTIYIVSVLTAQAAPNRTDLYIVDDIVRDNAGRILGCRALAQI